MKKTILSLGALLAVTIASAQSYAKQPDPSTYEVVYYQKPAATQAEVKEQADDTKTNGEQAQPNQDRKDENTSQDVKTTGTAVAVNDEKSSAKKRQ